MADKTKILYLEDEPFLAKIVKESLESRSFHVELVTDGNQAIPVYKKVNPDICVLDVMVPGKDGFTVGSEIRSIDPQIPIIFLTAKSQTDDVLKGFDSGGNDYLKKPFSVEELIVRIQNLLQLTNQSRETNPNVLELGKFRFYPSRHTLEINEKKISLSHRETQLLQMITARNNQQIERKQILLDIWGDDSYFNSRNLDVYIKKLRNYLAEDPRVRIITLKGVGYHFLVD